MMKIERRNQSAFSVTSQDEAHPLSTARQAACRLAGREVNGSWLLWGCNALIAAGRNNPALELGLKPKNVKLRYRSESQTIATTAKLHNQRKIAVIGNWRHKGVKFYHIEYVAFNSVEISKRIKSDVITIRTIEYKAIFWLSGFARCSFDKWFDFKMAANPAEVASKKVADSAQSRKTWSDTKTVKIAQNSLIFKWYCRVVRVWYVRPYSRCDTRARQENLWWNSEIDQQKEGLEADQKHYKHKRRRDTINKPFT